MRYRATIRGDKSELRGYFTTHTPEVIREVAAAVTPLGMLIVSEAPDDYDPFGMPEVTDAALAAAGVAMAVEMHGEGADQQDANYYARHLRPVLEAAYRITGAPQRDERGNRVIHLTSKEYGALSEAVRYSQEAHAENSESGERLNPTLSRIQRKLGEEPSY